MNNKQIEWGLQDWPREFYHAFDAANASTLMKFRKAPPAKVRYEITHPDAPTQAMMLGDATHAACLEPGRLELEYVKGLNLPRRKKVDQQEWADFELQHAEQVVLKPAEWDLCLAMRDAVLKNDRARELLVEGDGHTEISAIWQDHEFKIPCKLRADRFTSWHDQPVVVDLKTTKDASPNGFARSVLDYGYHIQASWYLDGLKQLAPVPRRFFFVCVEKDPPHLIATYELDEQALDQGYREARQYLKQYADCMRDGIWPGYPSGINSLSLPPWGIKREEYEGDI